MRSIKSECLDGMIFVGAGSLRHALAEYAEHCDRERPHQEIGTLLIVPDLALPSRDGVVARRARLAGLLNFYRRAAA